MSVTAWRRWDTELMWAPIVSPKTRRSESSLAFELHCSVFKKRLPDERARETCTPCRRDTHSAGARPQVARTEEAEVLVSTGPVVPALEEHAGVRGEESD